ncbi:MAG: hypothetical protein V1922_05840 [bacterium]
MNPSLIDLIQKTYVVLKDCMISGLDAGELTVEDSEKSAFIIERNMKQIESRGELLLFTSDLAKRYPAFQKAFITVKQNSVEEKDKNKLEALQAKLRQFSSSSSINGSQ